MLSLCSCYLQSIRLHTSLCERCSRKYKKQRDGIRKMSEIKLKPCPFCGSEPEIVDFGASVFVRCNGCRIRSRTMQASVDYAAKEWNQRVNELPKANWEREVCTSFWNCDIRIIENEAATCSRCKKSFFMPTDNFNYCPNCGARMVENMEETNGNLSD